MPASHFDVNSMTGRPKFIVRHSTCRARLPRLIRVEASNTAGRVHQLQAFLLFLRGRHYTFVYLAA
jgi:hypothetical protein